MGRSIDVRGRTIIVMTGHEGTEPGWSLVLRAHQIGTDAGRRRIRTMVFIQPKPCSTPLRVC